MIMTALRQCAYPLHSPYLLLHGYAPSAAEDRLLVALRRY